MQWIWGDGPMCDCCIHHCSVGVLSTTCLSCTKLQNPIICIFNLPLTAHVSCPCIHWNWRSYCESVLNLCVLLHFCILCQVYTHVQIVLINCEWQPLLSQLYTSVYSCPSKTAHNTLTWGIWCMHCHGFFKGLLFTVIEAILLHVLDILWCVANLAVCHCMCHLWFVCACVSVVVPMELCCVGDDQSKHSIYTHVSLVINTMKSIKVQLLAHEHVALLIVTCPSHLTCPNYPHWQWWSVFRGNCVSYMCYHCCLLVMILHYSIHNRCRP